MGTTPGKLTLLPFRRQPQWQGRDQRPRARFLIATPPVAGLGAPPPGRAQPPKPAPAPTAAVVAPGPSLPDPTPQLIQSLRDDLAQRLDRLQSDLQQTQLRLLEQSEHWKTLPREPSVPPPPAPDLHLLRQELIEARRQLQQVRAHLAATGPVPATTPPPAPVAEPPAPAPPTPDHDRAAAHGDIQRLRILLVHEQIETNRLREELALRQRPPTGQPVAVPAAAPTLAPLPRPELFSVPATEFRQTAPRPPWIDFGARRRWLVPVLAAIAVIAALLWLTRHRGPAHSDRRPAPRQDRNTGASPLPESAPRQEASIPEAPTLTSLAADLRPVSLPSLAPSPAVATTPTAPEDAATIIALESARAARAAQPPTSITAGELATITVPQGNSRAAIEHYRAAFQREPGNPFLANNLADLLATSPDPTLRNGPEALRLAELAANGTGNADPAVLDTLAAAYAEVGRYADAVRTSRRALQLAWRAQNAALAAQISDRQTFYIQGQPYHAEPLPAVETIPASSTTGPLLAPSP